jgi:pyruvate kinase
VHILLAEDNPVTLVLLRQELESQGHQVTVVINGEEAFHRAAHHPVDLLVTDLQMPDWDGFKCIEALAACCPELPVVIHSGLEPAFVEARLPAVHHVVAVVPKEAGPAALSAAIRDLEVPQRITRRRLARIVCTIGPACNQRAIIGRMLLAGMDVARLNFSHGSHEDHSRVLAELRAAEQAWAKPLAVLQDLCGPKIRVGSVAGPGMELVPGSVVVIQAESLEGRDGRFSTICPEILPDLRLHDPVLLDDGLLELEVIREGQQEVHCRVVNGGLLKSGKGINLPASRLRLPGVTDKDYQDLEWGVANGVDFVAISFVRQADDVLAVKRFLQARGSTAQVIAKIEKPEAVEAIDSIIEAADGIMIARGDMGVELSATRVPWIQRDILKRCEAANKPVITATQMLESMTHNSRPTRAEVTDVTVAIREGSDAVMLSGETAAGVDPVRVVRTMAGIIRESESHLDRIEGQQEEAPESWQRGLLAAVNRAGTRVTLALDRHGRHLPRLSKKIRNHVLVLVTGSLEVARRSSLYHGVIPVILAGDGGGYVSVLEQSLDQLRRRAVVDTGDLVAVIELQPEHRFPYLQEGSVVFIRA